MMRASKKKWQNGRAPVFVSQQFCMKYYYRNYLLTMEKCPDSNRIKANQQCRISVNKVKQEVFKLRF